MRCNLLSLSKFDIITGKTNIFSNLLMGKLRLDRHHSKCGLTNNNPKSITNSCRDSLSSMFDIKQRIFYKTYLYSKTAQDKHLGKSYSKKQNLRNN
jgi:hypothetical protein